MSKEKPWKVTSEEQKKKMTPAQLAVDELTDHINEVCLEHGVSCLGIFVVNDQLFSCGTGDGDMLRAGLSHVLQADGAVRQIVSHAVASASLGLAAERTDE